MPVELTAGKVRDARQLTVRRRGQSGATTYYRVEGCLELGHPSDTYEVRVTWPKFWCECCLTGTPRARLLRILRGCTHAAAVYMVVRRQRTIEALQEDRKAARAALRAADAGIPSPQDLRFGTPPIPSTFTSFRRHQWQAIEAVVGLYEDGASVVMVQAPPGSGKTLLGETVARLVGRRRLYVATTKTLQDQALRDFPYARVLKGRSNYATLNGNVDGWGRETADFQVSCVDCTYTAADPECRWCDPVAACPYRQARKAAEAADLAVLNTAYALTDWNKGMRRFSGRDLAIIDEADTLEGELLNQCEVNISPRLRQQLNMAPPGYKTTDEKRGRGPAEAWLPWVEEIAIPAVLAGLVGLPPLNEAPTRLIRRRKRLEELLERLQLLRVQLPDGGWVYDGYENGGVIFRPIKVDAWGASHLWPHAKRFLLMSGTIISADEMAASLGMPEGYELVDVPMTFDIDNRKINIVPLVEMGAKNADTAWPKMLEGLTGVLSLHPDERILCHTVSFKLAEYLHRHLARRFLDRPVITYTRGIDREAALERYKATPGAVLLAASMERGVDLPGDLCRVVVICKIPFPNLGDRRTNARLYRTKDGDFWYAVNTIRSLVQGPGRAVRSADDWAVTYILDHQFTTIVWRNNKRLLPGWWKAAVNWSFPAHKLLR